MNPSLYEPCKSLFLSSWTYIVSADPSTGGLIHAEGTVLDVLLAGVGAVGSACAHALWTCDGLTGRVLMADDDEKGLTTTNLNRYCLFGSDSLGKHKASEAARILQGSAIDWQFHDGGVEDIAMFPPRVISTVDVNTSRMAIQTRYPARIISASTSDLRAEVIRCGPPGRGACLRCFNPPEKIAPDEDLRARVRENPELVAKLALELNLSSSEVDEWANTGRCGEAGNRILSSLRADEDGSPPRFAVGFVSALAGVCAAAEAVKDIMGADVPLNQEKPRAIFQFVNPMAPTNRPSSFGRDSDCPMCDPEKPANAIWDRRFRDLKPQR